MISILALVLVAAAVGVSAAVPGEITAAVQPQQQPDPILTIQIPAGEAVPVDTTLLPDGLINYQMVNQVTGQITRTGSFTVQNAPLAQVVPTGDPWSLFSQTDGIATEIYENQSTFVIEYRLSDLNQDIVLELRAATAPEQAAYQLQRADRVAQAGQEAAEIALVGDPEIGEKWTVYVANRTAELLACEADGAAALTLGNWTGMGTGQQDAVIDHLITCGITGNKIERKELNALLQLLTVDGLVIVTE